MDTISIRDEKAVTGNSAYYTYKSEATHDPNKYYSLNTKRQTPHLDTMQTVAI